MSSFNLVLKSQCEGCESEADLYATGCRHMTLCTTCAKAKCHSHQRCTRCGNPITKLIREYDVKPSASTDKISHIGRFVTGLPRFSENKWSFKKEGAPEQLKNKPWHLEDVTGQQQYQGQIEGAQSGAYYVLSNSKDKKEIIASKVSSWYNFQKVAQYRQLTLEEAEEKLNKRKSNATGYTRWMMKSATNEKDEDVDGGNPFKKGANIPFKKEANIPDESHSDVEQIEDDDDCDNEKGAHWEHDEAFTDDDETNNINPQETEDLNPEDPAPPETFQDDDDEDEEQGGLGKPGLNKSGLSESGKEMKKLLGKTDGHIETDGPAAGDDENSTSSVLVPSKKYAPKDERVANNLSKAASPGTTLGTLPTSKLSQGKRKAESEDVKIANGMPVKKVKTENQSTLHCVKDDMPTSSKATVVPKTSSSTFSGDDQTPSYAPVTEAEIRAALLQRPPLTTQDFVAMFKQRLKSEKDKSAFAENVRRLSKVQRSNGQNYLVPTANH